jgi:hypothetical protein
MLVNEHDTWEATEAALRAAKKLLIFLHDNKPPETKKKDSPAELAFEEELKEVRKWCVTLNYRRIFINQRCYKAVTIDTGSEVGG